MKIKDLDSYSNAEKIILAEQLWDSISKDEIIISDEIKLELDKRLADIEKGNVELYSWDEVKQHMQSRRR